jgi:hypothetical protein
MLNLFSRRKSVRLNAFTSTPRLAEVLPPLQLSDSLPDWWQKTAAFARLPPAVPAPFSRIPTIKHCYGLQQLFKYGIGLPLWHDVNIGIEADGKVLSWGRNRKLSRPGDSHPIEQYSEAFSGNVQHYKFTSPWLFVCEAAVPFVWAHPTYHQKDPFKFQTMIGIAEYRHQHSTHVNVLLPKVPGQRTERTFAAGEMLVYLLPITDANVAVMAHEVTDQEMERISFTQNITNEGLLFSRRRRVAPHVPHG